MTSDGYRSAESKRAVHRAAWIGAVLIGLLQLVVPLVVIGWAIVRAFLGALQTPTPEVAAPAHFEDHIVYAVPVREEGDSIFSSADRRTLVRVALADEAAPQPIVEIEGDTDDPMLLAVGDAVWAFDDNAVSIVEGGAVKTIALAEPLPTRFWPVLVQGEPAVVTIERDFGTGSVALHLRVLEGDRFVAQRSADTMLAFDPRTLRVVAIGSELHVLVDGYDDPVHHAVWSTDGIGEWARTAIEHSEWTAVEFAGAPAVFELDDDDETTILVGWRPSAGWRTFMTEPDGHAFRIGAVTLPDDRVAIMTDTTFDGVAVTVIAPDGIVARHEHSASTLMEETIGLIVFSQLAPIIFTVLLTLVLARRMRIHAVGEHVAGARVVRYASLLRRGLAKAIDAAIGSVVPLALLVPRILDGEPLDDSTLVGVCMLWCIPVGLAFTVLEGMYGQTPGKRLLRIRVVSLDLRAPGIGAAFVRGLVGLVDGLFDGLVGIVAIATNRQWQRIGDQVAHTIVIEDAIVERY